MVLIPFPNKLEPCSILHCSEEGVTTRILEGQQFVLHVRLCREHSVLFMDDLTTSLDEVELLDFRKVTTAKRVA